MRYLFIALAFVFLVGFSFLSRQNPKFSGDPANYPSELKEFLKNISDQDKPTLEAFLKAWQVDSVFSYAEQSNIVRHSQKMLERKARPFPHFILYMGCMLAIKNSTLKQSNYTNWVNSMDLLLDNRKTLPTRIQSYLSFSINLLQNNSIYKSSSTEWKASSDDYQILIEEEAIFVEFKATDLTCFTRTDSIVLYKTKGRVNPLANEWQGQGGLVTWERGGFSPEEVSATIKQYTIDLTKSEYTAENVSFTNTNYFKTPIEGTLNDQVKRIASPEQATFPKFYSYTKSFNIKNIYKGVNYEGGLSMQGSKMVGTGTSINPARIHLYRNDTLVVECASLYFGFKPDRIVSERTSINIKLKKDSIFHPDLFFDFRTENREVILLKTDNFTSQGPYSNSYHRVEMNFDQLVWRIDENYMRFTAPRGSTVGKASFESVNFFNYNRYLDMQLMDEEHPLLSIRRFSRKINSETFLVDDYADYLLMSVEQVKHLVMRMSYGGFVYYDINTGMVTIKPRLHDYIAASVNKIDYDVINFNSTVESPVENAIFDLRTYDLMINGIPRIQVSDSQRVTIFPKNARIIMKENRNFQFDGTIEAGLITFTGSNLFFDYDSFKINLQLVDAVKLDYKTDTIDNFGFAVESTINSMINGLTGELLIDQSDNKSGRVDYPEYPIFRSREKSYVYFDAPSIYEGVYDANDFYFAVDPFVLDSLANLTASSMIFEGEFVSAGILPAIRQKLVLQDDNSLGFQHQTPAEGLPLFGGKGTFNNQIWLSNQGLKGNGTVNYLTSTSWSDDFNFFPDSMLALSQRYEIVKQTTATEYPQTSSVNNNIRWKPYQDVMWVSKTTENFKMFNDSTFLVGDLQLEPTGLSGWGKMELRSSDLFSDWFSYKSEEILADTSDFYLKSLQKEGFTVLTENVDSRIDFRQQKGWFRSNDGYSLVTFPENRYISYIDYFIWDMAKKELAMGSQATPTIPDYTLEDAEPEGPRFISTDPKQDSLNFVSPLAYYDYQNNLINATGVKFIEVADARIYPKDGLLTVNPDYRLRTLENAWLKADSSTQYHRLHTATISVTGRKKYSGLANYDFVDENGDVQIIHFSEVKSDTNHRTIATGEIFEVANFRLSPVYQYQGKVRLFANDSLLTFDGAVNIEHGCDKLKTAWLAFESTIDPNSIYIPVDAAPVDVNGTKLFNSFLVYYDSVHMYPAFLSARKSYSDNPLIQPQGYLYYDKAREMYKIGSKEKISDFSLSEDYLSFHRERCELYGEGKVKLGNDLGMVQLTNYGSISHELDEQKTEINLVMGIDFFIDESMINLMGTEIDSFPNLDAVNLSSPLIVKSTNAWVGEEKARQLQDELNLFGTIKFLPNELKHTILLNDLNLVWNDNTNSYQSVGKIGIGSINGIQVNKKVDGFFELRIVRSGDIMDLYLQLDRRTYYYFGYTRGVMQTLSHNRTYVETIMNMKEKDRKMKTPRGATPYNILISTDRKKDNFYMRWQEVLEERNSK